MYTRRVSTDHMRLTGAGRMKLLAWKVKHRHRPVVLRLTVLRPYELDALNPAFAYMENLTWNPWWGVHTLEASYSTSLVWYNSICFSLASSALVSTVNYPQPVRFYVGFERATGSDVTCQGTWSSSDRWSMKIYAGSNAIVPESSTDERCTAESMRLSPLRFQR